MNKLVLAHSRLWISVLGGVGVFALLPQHWLLLTRLLVCWNCGALLFLALIFTWMAGLTAEQIRSRYVDEDETAPFILVVVIVAALLSVVAIVEVLATLKQVGGAERLAHIALVTLTLVNSWLLVPTMFTIHYADAFYSAPDGARPLHFPDTPMPEFADFAYFSFTIAAACQTADVSTLNAGVRSTVMVHALISFLFNLAILGFAINVTAGLIGT